MSTKKPDTEYLSNRQKSRKPRGHGFWCRNCDRVIVVEYKKCPICGCRSGKKRFKS